MTSFIITGKIKPAVRMTQRSKWANPEAQEYLSIKKGIGLQLRAQMAQCDLEMLPPKTPLAVDIDLQCTGGFHNKDIDNLAKAVLDAAQGIVFLDDCWVDRLTIERSRGEEDKAVLSVEVIE